MVPPRPIIKTLACLLSTMTPQSTSSSTASYLDQARQLELPARELMLRRDPSVHHFWNRNDGLLERAWEEWGKTEEGTSAPPLDASLIHPKLREAFEEAWKDPSKEHLVRDLWEEVVPGVYKCQFFDLEKIKVIKAYFDKAADAGIPTRPPYGIVLNRGGFMLDPRSVGYFAAPDFQTFYRALIDTYMRPLGRLFFPEYIQAEDDTESFGFSIRYQPGKDQSIREHTDASSLTLNINLDPPDGEGWTGSSLYFKDRRTGEKKFAEFSPGVAIMHLGAIPHAALPIESGERSNMVLWLHGKNGRASYMPYDKEEQMSREERWSKVDYCKPVEKSWSPF